MAQAVCVQSVLCSSRIVARKQCVQRASSPRKPAAVCCVGGRFGKAWNKGMCTKVKLESSRKGLGFTRRNISIGERSSQRRSGRVCALQENPSILSALANMEGSCLGLPCSQQTNSDHSEAMEGWLEGCIIDIVRNLQEAPFLQYVFNANKVHKHERQLLSQEFFDKPSSWSPVRDCLRDAAPDGIILVHRLDQNTLKECCLVEDSAEGKSAAPSSQAGTVSSDDVCGLLVHGCKVRCNACYLLKTTRVATALGITTHFCVIQAKCFGPSLKSQLEATWLL